MDSRATAGSLPGRAIVACKIASLAGIVCCFAWLLAEDLSGQTPSSKSVADAGKPTTFALTAPELDIPACRQVAEGKSEAVDPEQLFTVLGLQIKSPYGWRPADVKGERGSNVQYVVAFKEARPIGTLFVAGTVTKLAFLKPDASYPGDVAKADQWQNVILPPVTSDNGARMAVFPPGVKTRAVLLTDDTRQSRSDITLIRFSPDRLQSVTPLAAAHADAQYTAFSSAGPPFTYRPSLVTSGTGTWQNTGKNPMGQINRPPVSDAYPAWFMLSWREPQTLCGLFLRDSALKFELEYFVGPDSVSPRAGRKSEWKPIKTFQDSPAEYYLMINRTVTFAPVQTRGLRMRILKSREGSITKIQTLHALTQLADDAQPTQVVQAKSVADPTTIAVTLPADGYLTLAIDDASGHRVRNLVTREKRKKGENLIGWNLMNEQGVGVPAGKYNWKAIYYPGLHHKYEMTVYPNVSQHAPGNSPWLNEMSGSGGWMADHTPPRCAAVVGDRVYLGSPVSESGVSLIECDLTGRKLWAHPSFAGFTGATHLAGDAGQLFVGADAANTAAAWGVDGSTEAVWAVDLKTKEVTEVARLEPTESRQRGIKGMAAKAGKLYMSVAAKDQWLNNAASLANVDFDNSLPRLRTKRKPNYAYEVVPDPQGDFARLFRLTGTPAGGAAGAKGGLIWLASESSGGSKAHIVLAFQEPVDLGSVVLPVPQQTDYKVKLSVLKADAPYPPDANQAKQWQDFEQQGEAPWDVAVAPPDTKTRALRITFFKGEDDLLTTLTEDTQSAPNLDDALKPKGEEKSALEFGDSRWSGRLEGMKLLRRRFTNVAPQAKVRVNSGKVGSDGVWDAQRNTPLSLTEPGIYVMQWEEAQALRGLALKEIDGKRTLIDVYTGTATGDVNLEEAANWEQVADYEQQRRDHHSGFDSYNGQARYVDGYVDFGKEVKTRAVRLRVVEQWADNLPDSRGIREDLGGQQLDAKRCRIFGVAAMKHIGGEPEIDTRGNQRIEVLDSASGKIVAETPLKHPGAIAFGPKGDLFAVSGEAIVKVDMQSGKHQMVIEGLSQPGPLAIDTSGNFYVFSGEKSQQNVMVYSPAGKLLREIGERGGYKPGPWNPKRMGNITALAVDGKNQLWAVADNYWPKRIALWTIAGEYVTEFLGNTAYGGGGVLDPYDKNRLFYGPLEFEIDWKAGTSRLKNLLTDEFRFELVPIRVGENQYIVTGPEFAHQSCGIVYRYVKDHIVMAAALGQASGFPPLATPDIHAALGSVSLKDFRFRWSDMNADGQVQADEVTLTPIGKCGYTTDFNRDLSLCAGSVVWDVEKILPSGVPVYKEQELSLGSPLTRRMADGNFLCFGAGDREPERVVNAQGEVIWTVASEGQSTHGLTRAAPYSSSQIVGHFGWAGYETTHAGDLGEFVVMHTNTGIWHILTSDGLLASSLFHDQRNKAKTWTMLEHDRGMSLDGVTVGQEHFSGYFCRTNDNKYYAIAGHNHISLVEIEGFDKFKRMNGTVDVTPQQLVEAEGIAQQQQKLQQFAEAPVIDCYQLTTAPQIDGKLNDWEGDVAAEFGDRDPITQNLFEGAQFRIGYTEGNLHLAWNVINLGPLKNTGQDWDRLFKTGAAVDLQMSTSPEASEDRRHPEEGDIRLLLTYTGKKPRAILYRAVVPGTAQSDAWHVISPTGEATFDQVTELSDVQMSLATGGSGYTLEATVPLKTLGLSITPGERLKIDWGVLQTDDNGFQVLRRLYWSNKATAIVADIPSEARLHPDLWGHVLFYDRSRDKATEFLNNSSPEGKKKDDLVQELLDE